MLVELDLPQAFSVRDENEFFPVEHLIARLNPDLVVRQVATGMHVNGGCTVFWGLVHHKTQTLTRGDVEAALRKAGFHFEYGSLQSIRAVNQRADHATSATT